MNHLGWLLGNRKHVIIGTNCAKGIDVVLSGWLVEHGFSHLVDISCWDDLGLWCGWLPFEFPNYLLLYWNLLIEILNGFALKITSKLDRRFWLGGKTKKYSVKDDFALLIKKPHPPPPFLLIYGGNFGTTMDSPRSTYSTRNWSMRKSL